MKNIILGIAVIAVIVLLAMKLMQPSIEGHWVAEYVIDNQSDTLKIDASKVQLNIIGDDYTFRSTLNQQEKGKVIHHGDYLIVQNQENSEYRMGISTLSKNELTLLMNVDNVQRKLVMRRAD